MYKKTKFSWLVQRLFSAQGLCLHRKSNIVRHRSLFSKEIGRGTLVAILWTMLADSGAVTIGLVGRHLLGGGVGENVLPNLAAHLMPSIIVGLYIAIVLAATMSTADSLLMVATSAAVRDYLTVPLPPSLSFPNSPQRRRHHY